MKKTDKLVTINKVVRPDIQVVIPKDNPYSQGEQEYMRISFIKAEMLIIEETCFSTGEKRNYHNPFYYACRFNKDIIEVCESNHGWIEAHPEINEAYRDKLAEKELLSDE